MSRAMTREEAIETLKANYPDACYGQLREAVDIAIKALSSQPEILRIPLGQWISYKKDCKKHGKDQADEIWRRMR